MNSIQTMLLALIACVAMTATAHAGGYIKIPDIDGESTSATDHKNSFDLISFEMGAENSALPSKGIIKVTFDRAFAGRARLQRLYRNKTEIPSMSLASGSGRNAVAYELQRVFIKSWSTSGDADDRPTEEVAFYYNKIALAGNSASTAEIDFVEVGGGGEAEKKPARKKRD